MDQVALSAGQKNINIHSAVSRLQTLCPRKSHFLVKYFATSKADNCQQPQQEDNSNNNNNDSGIQALKKVFALVYMKGKQGGEPEPAPERSGARVERPRDEVNAAPLQLR